MGTKKNPGRFDCYANAEPDEPMFVLLGRDPTAGLTVTLWVKLRQLLGSTNPEKIEEARECARALEVWAREHGKASQVLRAGDCFEQMILDCAEMIRNRRDLASGDRDR